ncbi:MAG: hypothetical protein HZA93_08085 [Verrucomicrobia bacterium]|nr:hypothetical protein [Verrucomicrobiota bacterium]
MKSPVHALSVPLRVATFAAAAVTVFGQTVAPVTPATAVTAVTAVTRIDPALGTTATVVVAAGAAAGAANGATAAVTVTRPVAPPTNPPTGAVEQPAGAGETSLTLDIGYGIRYVPPSRVTVPVGERLRLTGPSSGDKPVQWLKNGRDLAGATTNPLILPSVTSDDAGTYSMVVVDPLALTLPSQSLSLGVGPTDRLLNLSTRFTLAAGAGQSVTTGFVVAAGSGQAKRLILRAVGPSLAAFGVTNPLRAPMLKIYDSTGQPYSNGYAYPAVVGGPTYESDLAASLARTGAFPIPSGTLDAVVMMPFVAGAYTAQVTSVDNTAGTVLLEIYEVP